MSGPMQILQARQFLNEASAHLAEVPLVLRQDLLNLVHVQEGPADNHDHPDKCPHLGRVARACLVPVWHQHCPSLPLVAFGDHSAVDNVFQEQDKLKRDRIEKQVREACRRRKPLATKVEKHEVDQEPWHTYDHQEHHLKAHREPLQQDGPVGPLLEHVLQRVNGLLSDQQELRIEQNIPQVNDHGQAPDHEYAKEEPAVPWHDAKCKRREGQGVGYGPGEG
mmetsp:Transcript_16846/g.52813  ORF Transcript_16846/g.52813 Transcript_16846/m.52813 type:complete len:222 (-) Transcript_16846:35-700(-)